MLLRVTRDDRHRHGSDLIRRGMAGASHWRRAIHRLPLLTNRRWRLGLRGGADAGSCRRQPVDTAAAESDPGKARDSRLRDILIRKLSRSFMSSYPGLSLFQYTLLLNFGNHGMIANHRVGLESPGARGRRELILSTSQPLARGHIAWGGGDAWRGTVRLRVRHLRRHGPCRLMRSGAVRVAAIAGL